MEKNGKQTFEHHRLLNNLYVMYMRDLIDCALEKFRVKRKKCKKSVEEIFFFCLVVFVVVFFF